MKTFFVCAWLLIAAPGFAQLKPVDAGSEVTFRIRNFGFGVSGKFSGLAGTIVFDPAKPEAASFDVTVNSETINTDNSMRDNHLKEPDYFAAKNFPLIRFVSESVRANGKKGFEAKGKLTIKNHTRDLTIPFTATPSGGGIVFVGEFTINRRDFEIGGSSTISNELTVSLKVLAK